MDNFKFLTSNEMNLYCDMNTDIICRICLEKNQSNKKMCNIFDGTEPLYTMIMSCAAVQIMQGDGLPNNICQKCLNKLNIAWQFKLQCENSDTRLRQFYTNANIVQVIPQSTDYIDDKKNDKDYGFEEGSNDNEALPKIIDDFVNDTTASINEKKEKIKKCNKQKDDKSGSKTHQCETCGKVFNRREYLIQHIRIHTGEKPYCCCICEKRFVNSGHLTTHMRTHTGEKPHACTLCPKTFSTKQELKKHTMVHNGERPFVCVTCGKSFGSSSNLYSHLRHHTGQKDFTCEHCGKAFYTKQELKQHLVVHTGEKAFLCEYCNKRFSQSAHLRRHMKLHI